MDEDIFTYKIKLKVLTNFNSKNQLTYRLRISDPKFSCFELSFVIVRNLSFPVRF